MPEWQSSAAVPAAQKRNAPMVRRCGAPCGCAWERGPGPGPGVMSHCLLRTVCFTMGPKAPVQQSETSKWAMGSTAHLRVPQYSTPGLSPGDSRPSGIAQLNLLFAEKCELFPFPSRIFLLPYMRQVCMRRKCSVFTLFVLLVFFLCVCVHENNLQSCPSESHRGSLEMLTVIA